MAERICLVVDDEPAICRFLGAALREAGFQCLEAQTATEALRVVQRLDGQLDLLIADVEMPGDMDGVDLAHSVTHAFPAIPVIMISGNHAPVTDGFAFVRKPFATGAILEAVERAIRAQRNPATDGKLTL